MAKAKEQANQAYLAAEAKARVEIDRQLEACGWLVQDRADLNLYAYGDLAGRPIVGFSPGGADGSRRSFV